MISVMCMDSAPTFDPAATFGQLAERIFSTANPMRLASRDARVKSGNYCEYSGGKSGAAFWLRKAHHHNRAGFRNLIEIRKQLNLIVVCTQNVPFKGVIVLASGDS